MDSNMALHKCTKKKKKNTNLNHNAKLFEHVQVFGALKMGFISVSNNCLFLPFIFGKIAPSDYRQKLTKLKGNWKKNKKNKALWYTGKNVISKSSLNKQLWKANDNRAECKMFPAKWAVSKQQIYFCQKVQWEYISKFLALPGQRLNVRTSQIRFVLMKKWEHLQGNHLCRQLCNPTSGLCVFYTN